MSSGHSGQGSGAAVHILIVGAGAVGCFYGSKLHAPEAGVYVSLVCRRNYQVVAARGVEMQTHSFGDYHFAPHAVFASVAEARTYAHARHIPWHYVVVCTKALPDVTNDADTIQPLVTPGENGSCIVLVQNGVGIEEPHRIAFPDNPIVSAVTVVSAEQIAHGVVRQNRWTRITLGPYTNGQAVPNQILSVQARIDSLTAITTAHVDSLVRWFTAQGITDAEVASEVDLQLTRWHKLCINASMNPSSVLAGATPNARMALDPELRIHLAACMDEIFTTAPKILGKPFDNTKHASPERILRSTERNTSGKPSMLLDWIALRPMELEVILGNPIRIARRQRLQMPRLHTLYSLLKMAQTRRFEDARDQKSRL